MKPTTFFLLFLTSLLLAACGAGQGENAATRTAQAERDNQLATQMALNYQNTLQVKDRQATGTAVTFKELATQAIYDQQATAAAEIKQQTAIAAEATASAQALQHLLQAAQDWPPLLLDTFDQPSPSWTLGKKSGQTADLSLTIASGKYRWDVLAKTGGVYWVDPELPPTSDFYLAVDVQQIGASENAQAGLVLRATQDSFWCFLVDNQGQVFLGQLIAGDWRNSMPLGLSAVHLDHPNHLAVLAQGERLVFLINGEDIFQVSDDRLLEGIAGLMVYFQEPGDQSSWEFDNFELRLPPSASPQATATP